LRKNFGDVWLYPTGAQKGDELAESIRPVEDGEMFLYPLEVRRRTRPMVCFVNVESVDRIIYSIFQIRPGIGCEQSGFEHL